MGLAILAYAVSTMADEYELTVPILIRGGTVIPSAGQKLEQADVLILHGRIQAVGGGIDAPAGARVIPAAGLYIYPGFIDGFCRTAIEDDKAQADDERRRESALPSATEGPVVEMPQAARVGVYPERDALERVDAKDASFDAHRAAGFGAVLLAPPQAMFGGSASVISLARKPLREAVLRSGVAQTASFEAPRNRALRPRGSYPGTLLGVIASERQLLMDAQWYRDMQAWVGRHPESASLLPLDRSLQALQPVLGGAMPVVWEADSADELDRVRSLGAEFGLSPWVVGARRAYKRLDALASANATLIVSAKLPAKPEKFKIDPKKLRKAAEETSLFGSAWEERPFVPEAQFQEVERERKEIASGPAQLQERGIRWCFTTADEPAEMLDRVHEFVEAGLTPDAAMAALTSVPADLLGVAGELGSIAIGKRGTVTLLTKPLGESDARVQFSVIEGQVFEYDVRKPRKSGKGGRPERRRESEEPELHCDSIRGGADAPDPQDTPPLSDEPSGSSEPDEAEQPESQPASSASSAPAEPDIPPGPLDVYLQHKPEWPIELEASRKPAFGTAGNVVLGNATVLTVSGAALQHAGVRVRDGKIAQMGGDVVPQAGELYLDLGGYFIMPSIIDPHSHIALEDVNEFSGSVTPEVRMRDVIDSEQRRIFDSLTGGCSTIHAMHGSANTIGGQNVQLKLKYGEPAEKLLIPDQQRTVKFATGENVKSSRGENTLILEDDTSPTRFPRSRMGVETTMRRALGAGADYLRRRVEHAQARSRRADPAPLRRDLRLEALADIVAGDIWINMHCYRADEVLRAMQVAEDYGVRMGALHHILEGYRIMPEIARYGVGTATFSDWWAYKIEAYDAVPHNAGMLLRHGINSTIKSDSSDLMRHLNLEAAKCMQSSNLTSDEALRLITINPARLFGLEQRVGSIEIGKDADLAVFDGHPLDTFSHCVMTLSDGEVYFLARGFDPRQPTPAKRPAMEFFQDRLNAQHADEPTWPRDGAGRLPPEEISLTPLVTDGQTTPPARPIAIVNAQVHPVSAPDLERASVVLRDGRIAAIDASNVAPDDCIVLDAAGLHLYPGLINAATRVGLQEIEAIPVTIDTQEIGHFQPDVFALSGYNPHSRMVEVARSAGVLAANVIPAGPFVAGQSGVMHLDGWTMPEGIYADGVSLLVRIPSLAPKPIVKEPESRRSSRFREERERREKHAGAQQRRLKEFFENARRYAAGRTQDTAAWRVDPRFEQMRPYINGERPVLLSADSYKEILEALMFAEQLQLKAVLLGGQEAWRVADLLASKRVPVLYDGVMDMPGRYDEWDCNYRAASVMAHAGVTFAFVHAGADLCKQLASEAGFAVAHGLDPALALRAITLTPAEILGIDNDLGSLDVGKLANVIITTGDPLQASTRVVHAFVRGKPVSLENAHTRQAQKFADRPTPRLAPSRDDLRGSPSQTAR